MNPIAFSYNSIGELEIELPQGAKSDSYKLYLFVNIIDDLGGTLVYNLNMPVIVESNELLKQSLSSEMLSTNPSTDISISSDFLQQLNSGDVKTVSKNVINMANELNLDSKNQNLSTNDQVFFFSFINSVLKHSNN